MFTYRRLSPVAIPQSAGSAASVLERGRLRGFGLGARPAPQLRSWSGIAAVRRSFLVILVIWGWCV